MCSFPRKRWFLQGPIIKGHHLVRKATSAKKWHVPGYMPNFFDLSSLLGWSLRLQKCMNCSKLAVRHAAFVFRAAHTWGEVHEVFAQTFPTCCYKNPRDRELWSGGRGEILCVYRGGALDCCCNGRKNHPQKNESLLGVLRVAIALRKFPPIFARDEIPPPPRRLSPVGWYLTRGADFCIVVGQKRGRTDGVAIFGHTRLWTMWWGVHVQQHERCHTQYKYYGTGRCHMQS